MMLKRKLNSKGFVVSPFFVVVLIFLGISLVTYFSQSDLERAKSITREGQINQVILDMEELKPIMQTLTLFSAYQSAYEVGETSGGKGELEKKIEEYMNDYFKNYTSTEGVIAKRNFSIFIIENPGGNFLVKVNKTPIFEINKSGIYVNSSLSFERVIDARFFLLYTFSEKMNKSYLIDSYTMEVVGQLINELNFDLFNYTIENETRGGEIFLAGTISDEAQANNGSFIAKIFENAIIDLEKDSKLIFQEMVNKSCIIAFMPKLITVNGSKEIFENNTLWEWKVNVSLIVKIFDHSKVREEEMNHGNFLINVSEGIILKNGSLVPLGYKVMEEKTNFFYHILVIYDAIDTGEFNSYTEEMFDNETHLPSYIFMLSQ
jgi:hypothetical protein